MKNKSVIYGIATGLIVSFGMLVWWLFPPQRERIYDLGASMMFVLGMMNMVLGFMSVVILHKRMHNEIEGPINFMALFKPAIMIIVIASVIYVFVWMVVYENGGQELVEVLEKGRIEKIETSHHSPEIKSEKLAEFEEYSEAYHNNVAFRCGMTFVEVFPIGLIFSILSSLIFRRRKQNFLPM